MKTDKGFVSSAGVYWSLFLAFTLYWFFLKPAIANASYDDESSFGRVQLVACIGIGMSLMLAIVCFFRRKNAECGTEKREPTPLEEPAAEDLGSGFGIGFIDKGESFLNKGQASTSSVGSAPLVVSSNLADYYMQLDRHDWYFAFSDSPECYKLGCAKLAVLQILSKKSDAHLALFKAFSRHYSTGEPWGNVQEPKPVLAPKVSQAVDVPGTNGSLFI